MSELNIYRWDNRNQSVPTALNSNCNESDSLQKFKLLNISLQSWSTVAQHKWGFSCLSSYMYDAWYVPTSMHLLDPADAGSYQFQRNETIRRAIVKHGLGTWLLFESTWSTFYRRKFYSFPKAITILFAPVVTGSSLFFFSVQSCTIWSLSGAKVVWRWADNRMFMLCFAYWSPAVIW